MIVVILILLALGVGGFFYFRKHKDQLKAIKERLFKHKK